MATAETHFHQHTTDCLRLVQHLHELIERDLEEATSDTLHWGHVGSMEAVRSRLAETVAFMTNLEPAAIDSLLAEWRDNK